MSKFKKLTAILLSAVMLVCMFAVPAGAANSNFSSAKTLAPMQTVSAQASKNNVSNYYKIVIKQAGSIQFNYFATKTNTMALYNSSGKSVIAEDTFPNVTRSVGNWKNSMHMSYHLDKGTYYLKLTMKKIGDKYNDFWYSFEPDKKPEVYFGVTMTKGSTLNLGYVAKNYTGDITWKTSKSSVASVTTKGKVTAKAAGTAYIRLYYGDEYIRIKVTVK